MKQPRLKFARQIIATARSKKQNQCIYEAIPEGAAHIKTADSTLTIKVPGQQDTVLNKSDNAKLGGAEQKQIPLINFASRKTVRNHHAKFMQSLETHAQEEKLKILGDEPSERGKLKRPQWQRGQVQLRKSQPNKNPPKEMLPAISQEWLSV